MNGIVCVPPRCHAGRSISRPTLGIPGRGSCNGRCRGRVQSLPADPSKQGKPRLPATMVPIEATDD